MLEWRLLVEDGRKAGHIFSQPDLIIAATALHHGPTTVTRDVDDYERTRAPLPKSDKPHCFTPRAAHHARHAGED
jgi:predicted nucleic acid-binding protein